MLKEKKPEINIQLLLLLLLLYKKRLASFRWNGPIAYEFKNRIFFIDIYGTEENWRIF